MRQLAPDRVEALFACFDARQGIRAAARLAGVARGTARRWHGLWQASAARPTLRIALAGRTSRHLARAARERGTTPYRLAEALLEHVVEDCLIDAVLGRVGGPYGLSGGNRSRRRV